MIGSIDFDDSEGCYTPALPLIPTFQLTLSPNTKTTANYHYNSLIIHHTFIRCLYILDDFNGFSGIAVSYL